jgi:hypothetical protein
MTNLNFPSPPIEGMPFMGENGVAYVYDGTKWVVDTSDANNIQYWSRNDPLEELQPRYFEDTILFTALGVDRLEDLP